MTGKQNIDKDMKNENKCPERVRKAVLAFARAVSLVADMADLHGADPQTEFHVVEYLPDLDARSLKGILEERIAGERGSRTEAANRS